MNTELTLRDRVVTALAPVERDQELIDLAAKSVSITTITNPAGYQQVHAARMTLKGRRVEIEKFCKKVREDATAFGKAVIAEEKRLVDLIVPEEGRLAALQGSYDAAIELEKAEAAAAEERRKAALQARVETIRMLADDSWMLSSASILKELEKARAMVIGDDYQEFRESAQSALFTTIRALEGIHLKQQEKEADEERLKSERAELLRLRKAEEERQAAERARLAEEERTTRAAREVEAAKDREALRKQREEHEAAAKIERDRIAEENRRLATERAAFQRQQDEARKVAEAQERERAEQARLANIKRPSDAEIVAVLAGHYQVPDAKVVDWLNWKRRMVA